jgi:hypothetical protein
MVYVELTDQRVIGFPADRFRRLKAATALELAEVVLEVGGTALRWETLDDWVIRHAGKGHYDIRRPSGITRACSTPVSLKSRPRWR